jgi:hypothetical protein
LPERRFVILFFGKGRVNGINPFGRAQVSV